MEENCAHNCVNHPWLPFYVACIHISEAYILRNHLYAFHVDNFTWRVMESQGKAPSRRTNNLSAFVNTMICCTYEPEIISFVVCVCRTRVSTFGGGWTHSYATDNGLAKM